MLELANPIPGTTAIDLGHVPWSTLAAKTPFSIGYPSDKPVGTVWQVGSASSFLESPFRWLDGGEKGLLYTDALANLMLFPPNGNLLDFSWNWHTLPWAQVPSDEPASNGCGF